MKTVELVILFIFAFLPPIIYVIWIRNTEKYNREKWRSIFLCFIWGATIAIIASLILEVMLSIPLAISINDYDELALITAIIVAPFVEEFTKPLALRMKAVKKELDELEDGLIYGAVAGLGFSATENLIYGWSFLSETFMFFILLMILRSVGGCLLHASATALTGYGYGKYVMKKTSVLRILPYFILAIFVHSFYNYLLSFDMMGQIASLFAALSFTIIIIHFVRNKIKTLDIKTSQRH